MKRVLPPAIVPVSSLPTHSVITCDDPDCPLCAAMFGEIGTLPAYSPLTVDEMLGLIFGVSVPVINRTAEVDRYPSVSDLYLCDCGDCGELEISFSSTEACAAYMEMLEPIVPTWSVDDETTVELCHADVDNDCVGLREPCDIAIVVGPGVFLIATPDAILMGCVASPSLVTSRVIDVPFEVLTERCDGIDNDCNGQVDEAFDFASPFRAANDVDTNCDAIELECPPRPRQFGVPRVEDDQATLTADLDADCDINCSCCEGG